MSSPIVPAIFMAGTLSRPEKQRCVEKLPGSRRISQVVAREAANWGLPVATGQNREASIVLGCREKERVWAMEYKKLELSVHI